jgi:threonine dehydrogenase-like Zn-dependent dehydrogenase
MRAMTVVPGEPGTAAVVEVADPARETGGLLVRGLLVGVCGTDREIAEGAVHAGPAKLARTEEGTLWLCASKTTL